MEIFFKSIVLGIIEGITEFLPISSTGHLILTNELIKFDNKNFVNVFDIVIQLGAILSVIVYFWDKLYPFSKKKSPLEKKQTWDIWFKTIVGVLPAIIFGVLFSDKIEESLFNSSVVAMALIVGGFILIIIEKRQKKARFESVSLLTYRVAIFIGFFQCLAMIPGTSRSAATIVGAMALGVSRATAAEFSFFLAIPTMVGATAYSLYKSGYNLTTLEWQVLGVGFMVSFFVAWAVVALFMNYIRKNNFIPFAYYRIVLGVIVFSYFLLRHSPD